MNFNDPEQIEAFQRLYIKPMVDDVQQALAPLVETVKRHEADIASIKASQKKALMGYAGIVAVGTFAFNYIKAKWLSKLFS